MRIAATLSAKLFIPFPESMTHLPLLCQINKEVSGVTGDEKCVLGTRMGLSCNRTKKVIHLIPSLPDILTNLLFHHYEISTYHPSVPPFFYIILVFKGKVSLGHRGEGRSWRVYTTSINIL